MDKPPNRSPCRIGKTSYKQWCQEEFVGASFVESSLAPVLNLAIHCEEVLNPMNRNQRERFHWHAIPRPEKRRLWSRESKPTGQT